MDTNECKEQSKLKDPILKSLARDPDKLYCEICLNNCAKRNKKRTKMAKIDKERFEKFATNWEKVDHHYNVIYKRVDWTMDEMLACASCKGTFKKKTYLESQTKLEANDFEEERSSERTETQEIQSPSTICKSKRKELVYETGKDFVDQRCIIYN